MHSVHRTQAEAVNVGKEIAQKMNFAVRYTFD
ncbi:MAG: hypothetical protein LBT58_03685 [Endomicrobium sp.]|nr:hypothetical protein [Endomicrobium sp.]